MSDQLQLVFLSICLPIIPIIVVVFIFITIRDTRRENTIRRAQNTAQTQALQDFLTENENLATVVAIQNGSLILEGIRTRERQECTIYIRELYPIVGDVLTLRIWTNAFGEGQIQVVERVPHVP